MPLRMRFPTREIFQSRDIAIESKQVFDMQWYLDNIQIDLVKMI